jgi:colicin import membrane protein
MLRTILYNPVYLVLSLLVHAFVAALLIVSFEWNVTAQQEPKPNVVEAVVVDQSKVQAEIEKLKQAEQQKQANEKARLKKLEKKIREAKRKRAAEEKRLAAAKKKRAVEEKKRKAEEKKLALQKKKEKQRLAKIKKEQEELEKKRQLESKRLAELEKSRKREEELKKKREAEEKAKKLAAEKKRREDALRKQLAAEERAEQEARFRTLTQKYIGLIQGKVTRSWIRPVAVKKGLTCIVKVKLIPGGEVIDARVVKSSGNTAFDRSVETAVLKASPLPMPTEPGLQQRFRDITFEFKPEG